MKESIPVKAVVTVLVVIGIVLAVVFLRMNKEPDPTAVQPGDYSMSPQEFRMKKQQAEEAAKGKK